MAIDLEASGYLEQGENLNCFRPDLLILATCPYGHKDENMRQMLIYTGLANVPVITGYPGTLPDELYYSPDNLDESVFNGKLTYNPELVAAFKSFQLEQHYKEVLATHITNPDMLSFYLRPDLKPKILIIANDIMLHSKDSHGHWHAWNKPKTEDDIFPTLEAILGAHENRPYREARIICGAAAYDPVARRGITGSFEVFLLYKPFTQSEIKNYRDKYTSNQLLSSNGSCRWDDPYFFNDHLHMVNCVPRTDRDYPQAQNYLHSVIQGALPGIDNLVYQALVFSKTNAWGKATEDMNKLFKTLKIDRDCGIWGSWNPKLDK